ncbi:MAG: aspartate kinase [Deltaproteobacteria bacterium]|nr:aspartate kinase [Deltaproteobacteria bacterium]
MALIVQKYGGSSLATLDRIQEVARRVSQRKKEGNDLVVVVSAMGNTTNDLLKLAQQITDQPPARELDMLLSSGERISMALLAMALHQIDVPSISFTGSQSGIVTDTSHTHAKILEIRADRIKEQLTLEKVVIVAGFQGVSTQKEVTTLGRGGSDVTAVALAVALSAKQCEFYKDVDGIYTKDPKQHIDAQKMEHCDYDRVLTLAHAGAKILHSEAVTLAKKHLMPLYIASSFTQHQGTLVEQHH